MNKKVFWFDVETTGLDAKRQDIIQLAYLIEIDKEIKEEGSLRLQPFNYATIDKMALEVSKTTIEDLKTYQSPPRAYQLIVSHLDKYVDKYNKQDKFAPAGYNIGFDTRFLKEFFLKNNNKYYGAYFNYHLLDVFSLLFILEYKGLLKLENYKLETVAKYFDINYHSHNALDDIKTTRIVFQKLLQYIK